MSDELMKREIPVRTKDELFPDYTAFVDEIDKNGITPELLYKIIRRHKGNSLYNQMLYNRYLAIKDSITIHHREPRFEEDKPINNKVSNDFFGEIIDFKTGYFAGEPISYGYSKTDEAEEVTGGMEAVDEATKTITDFVTRNNMFGVDMETTRFATIYGYAGRLFYIDTEGVERVMPVHGFETIPLSKTNISEPKYAVRYFKTTDIDDNEKWVVEFYDNADVYTFEGMLSKLEWTDVQPHCFDYCPLQGIANNEACMGDSEKVLPLIDDYDKVFSDNSNEIESFVHAIMVVQAYLGSGEDGDKEVVKATANGIMYVPPIGTNTASDPVKWATKNINDAFTEHHLQRTEDNIYRFSKTPNMNDEAFGSASGVALKFRLHPLETKCATFEANVMDAAQHMWRVLCSSWAKRKVILDPLQITMEYHRNFPLDRLSEAQTAQALIGAGFPKEWVFSQTAGVDDVDYVMELLEKEKSEMALYTAVENAVEEEEADETDESGETEEE